MQTCWDSERKYAWVTFPCGAELCCASVKSTSQIECYKVTLMTNFRVRHITRFSTISQCKRDRWWSSIRWCNNSCFFFISARPLVWSPQRVSLQRSIWQTRRRCTKRWAESLNAFRSIACSLSFCCSHCCVLLSTIHGECKIETRTSNNANHQYIQYI